MEQNEWKHISKAPKDGTFIVLLMDSGYTTTPYALAIAKYDKNYRTAGNIDCGWRNHAGDSIFDEYEKIIAWREWILPYINFEDEYIYLKNGEKAMSFDEIKRGNEWIELLPEDFRAYRRITGKDLVVCKEFEIRRKRF